MMFPNERSLAREADRRVGAVESTLRLEGLELTPETRTLLRRFAAHEITMPEVLTDLRKRYTHRPAP